MNKDNGENELYKDMSEFKREFATPLFRLYNRLISQEFVRLTDEERLSKMLDEALHRFNDLVTFYSTPPESNSVVPLDEL